MTYPVMQQTPTSPATNPKFFAQVMTWLAGSFVAMAVGVFFFGPLIPASLVLPLYFVALGVMIVSAFVRLNRYVAGPLAIAIPTILGTISYPMLNSYVEAGMGGLIFQAAVGAIVIFGGMAIWGWTTPSNIQGWGKPLFFITLGLIAVSLLNILIGASWLGTLIAMGALVLFSIWTMYDIQSLKNAAKYGTTAHPATYALNIWLDLWNIFMSLLRIMSAFR